MVQRAIPFLPRGLTAERLQQVRGEVHAAADLSTAYLVMNATAIVIAGLGLLQNSPAVIIGAMLIAMLLGPIQGVALALAEADMAGFVRALRSEVAGVVWVLLIGAIVGIASRDLPIGSEILSRSKPTILDLGVALAGGLAGGYAAVSRRVSGAVVGVAIATALVPPLTACAILAVRGLPGPAIGCFLNFATNFTAIALSQMLVFLIAGFRPSPVARERRAQTAVARTALVVLLAALGWYLIGTFRETVGTEMLRATLIERARQELASERGARVLTLEIEPGAARPLTRLVVRAPHPVTPERTAQIQRTLSAAAGRDLDLHVRTVITIETIAGDWAPGSDDALEAVLP